MSELDDAERRELRIAPVMTGGTSLAVWIGGVTAELYSVVNREPGEPPTSATDVYGNLLELTSTDAIVDVITGAMRSSRRSASSSSLMPLSHPRQSAESTRT